MVDRIVTQREADEITGTERTTRRRMERKGIFPLPFKITPNGPTGYLESELEAWVAARAADRTPSTKTAVASAVLAERRRGAAGCSARDADSEDQSPPGARRGRKPLIKPPPDASPASLPSEAA